MKYRYVNERLNTIITERTPKEETTISFVMSLLHLSKESAYRRLRNEIPYTVREVAVLTTKLTISLDELFDAKEEKAPLRLNLIESASPADSYADRLRTVNQVLSVIEFYRRIRFITDLELLDLQKELLELLNQFEKISRTGYLSSGSSVQLYLSDLPVESNLVLIDRGEEVAVIFPNSGGYPIVSTSTKVFEAEKEWFDSLLKFSVLMTRSNEILQSNYFSRQRCFVKEAFTKMLG